MGKRRKSMTRFKQRKWGKENNGEKRKAVSYKRGFKKEKNGEERKTGKREKWGKEKEV